MSGNVQRGLDPNRLRPLLPSTTTSAPQNAPFSSPISLVPVAHVRENLIPAACQACRKRKCKVRKKKDINQTKKTDHFKCSGERPKCSRCIQQATECVYTTNVSETHSQALKRKYSTLVKDSQPYKEIFELLKSVSEQDATEIIRKMKSGVDPSTILQQVTEGNLLLQLSLAPEVRFRYEFPRKESMPPRLLQRDSPYFHSLLYEAVSVYPWGDGKYPGSHGALSSDESSSQIPPSVGTSSYRDSRAPYLSPIHAAELIEARMENVKPSQWTSVCKDDKLMRRLLRAYFLHEYNWFPTFQKQYFLQDMEAQNQEFCSSLLVNTVLAYSCVRQIDGIQYRFTESSFRYATRNCAVASSTGSLKIWGINS
jgi:hypothetical protein